MSLLRAYVCLAMVGFLALSFVQLAPPVAAQGGGKITITCPSSVTLTASAEATEREVDYPGGKDGDEVAADAAAGATASASAEVARDLERQSRMINCAQWEGQPCTKIVSAQTITTTVTVTSTSYGFGAVVIYKAVASATGTVTVTCECNHP